MTNYVLIFEDDFNGTSIDTNKWNKPSGTWIWPWTDLDSNNVSVDAVNSMVRLKISTATTGKPYRGCILENYAGNIPKQTSFQYGRCEVRARLPPSNYGIVGYILLWPYDNTWPPEIDFVECDGRAANTLFFTQHWCQYTGNSNQSCKNITGYVRQSNGYTLTNIDTTQWHTYAVELTNTSVTWYVDGILKVTQVNKNPGQKWIFSAGIWAGCCSCPADKWGGWGGCPTGHPFPQYMDIDYVRLYKPGIESCQDPVLSMTITK